MNKTLKEHSRINYVSDDPKADNQEIMAGSLQRIADATELMAKNYLALQSSELYWQGECLEARDKLDAANRRITALKGVITKLKKKRDGK